ncbi:MULTISPECIES: hypothetical protein [unclassified Rathayibacter]|uniref:hypothetical protein n=1 Tax=unclassified Rathayibacter TaxID=2609250 RepID=UPI000700579E|nr:MULTISPECIES: hypothetical protein [unclassified Rathayibacter]KQQ00582.1 hypothetical protein ASF42_14605 [Rathayibacter sp. Leaf294]KQS10781.1 hypothetical protein ASG06_14605 [Rathayibacter sp. Leaf185]
MGSSGATQERGTAQLGGFEVVGTTPRGALVVGSEGAELSALLVPRERATEVLRGPLARLAPHAHRESLVDAAVVRDGLVLVTTPPVVTTLETILASHEPLSAGVVVTVLGPVVEAVREAAVTGVDLVVGAGGVGLTRDGSPVVLIADLTESDESPAEALRSLIARCAERCSDRLGPPAEGADLGALEAFLYRAASPLPVGDLLFAEPLAAETPGTGPGPAGPWARRLSPLRRGRLPTAARRRRAEHEEPAPESPGRHRRAHPLDGWQARLLGAARSRRGPLAAAAVIITGAVVASAVSAGPAPDPSSAPRVTASTALPAPEPTTPDAEASPESAAAELVSTAAACAASSPKCLTALTTGDSPLRSGGVERFDALLPDRPAVRTVVADENGGSALVSLESEAGTTAASVLIIRTEAGWLIRDVFARDPP